MTIHNDTIERAIAMAERDGIGITEENADVYFMAALAQEMEMIKSFTATAKGQKVVRAISDNMAERMMAGL